MLLDKVQLGRYHILRFIRKGGMSEIYLAEDTRMARQVAIKILQKGETLYPDETVAQEASRLFLREMGIVSNLYHPHILQLYDFGEETVGDTPFTYMVMPFHAHGSLVDWLQQHNKESLLLPEETVALVVQAADALQYAHDSQVVHLDVKPSNFLVHPRKEKPNQPDLFLTDFGIARIASTSKGSAIARGTVEYMAPEQWDGHPVAASDQYSLAIMAYELLTGLVPFRGNMSQIMYKHFQETPLPPSELNPHVPSALDAVILRALEKKPEDRFPSISEFARELQQALRMNNGLHVISQKEALPATDAEPKKKTEEEVPATLPQPAHSLQSSEDQTVSDVAFAMQNSAMIGSPKPPAPSVSASYPGRNLMLVVLACTLIITGVISFGIYQNNAYRLNAAATASANSTAAVNAVTATSQANDVATATAATAVAGATATVVAANPYPFSDGNGTLALYDPLSQSDHWANGSNSSSGGLCQFTEGAYHMSETNEQSAFYCTASDSFSDFAFQVQMTIVQGDCGGVTFRGSSSNGAMYAFVICQDGTYHLEVYRSNTDSNVLLNDKSDSINQGLNQTNDIAVVANGNSITLYVNGKSIDQTNDDAYSKGIVGLMVREMNNSTEVAFSNARVWTL